MRLTSILSCVLLCSCGVPAEILDEGTIECRPTERSEELPVYRFDAQSETTRVFQGFGAPTWIEFQDLSTEESVILNTDQPYHCEPIGSTDP